MGGRSRQERKAKGSAKRSISMGELQTILANMRPEQRSALLKMFPEPTEPVKLPEKITRRQLRTLWDTLEALMDTPSRSVEFAYAIVQNRAKMGPEIKKLDRAKEPSDAYKAFDAERLALCEEFADKDAQENPVHDGERYAIPPERQKKFEKYAARVRNKHAEAIENYKAQASRYGTLLDGEIACPKFVLIPMRALPLGLTARQLEPLQIILE